MDIVKQNKIKVKIHGFKGSVGLRQWDDINNVEILKTNAKQFLFKSECESPCGELIIKQPHMLTSHRLDLD